MPIMQHYNRINYSFDTSYSNIQHKRRVYDEKQKIRIKRKDTRFSNFVRVILWGFHQFFCQYGMGVVIKSNPLGSPDRYRLHG